MSFERTVRHVNAVKDECKSYSNSKTDSDVSVASTFVQPPPAAAAESSVSATDAEAEAPMVQSAADIAENKRQEEIAAKSKAEMIKLMTNQRKLQRAKEKRESRIKEQLDSISVSDAEQRFAKVQQNKVANVRDVVSPGLSFFFFLLC
jgi:C1A family cysteine protease